MIQYKYTVEGLEIVRVIFVKDEMKGGIKE